MKVKVKSLSHVRLFVTPWIAARQASLSITNSRSSLRLMSIKSVGLHRTTQHQLFQHYCLGHRLGLLWYWMVCLGNRDHSVIFEIAPKYCILDSLVDYDGYSFSSTGFLPTVVDTMVIWVKFTHFHPFWFIDSQNVDVHSCHLLFDHFQFTLIHGANTPGSYAILFFTASDFTRITSHSHNWVLFRFGSVSSFFLELFLHSSLVAYWVPAYLGHSSFSVICFYLFILFMGFLRQGYWSGLPFLSPSNHILSELSTMTRPWVALHGMAHWVLHWMWILYQLSHQGNPFIYLAII